MRADAERLVAPQCREIVRLIDEPILQPIYDLETPHMAFGRVAIMGDAAFVARPHVAAGVAKAADDAGALAEALDAGRTTSRRPCGDSRRSACRSAQRIIQRARHLGAYLQASSRPRRSAPIRRATASPEAVLAETAVLDFL